jgi:AraC-like DNA-binding protein
MRLEKLFSGIMIGKPPDEAGEGGGQGPLPSDEFLSALLLAASGDDSKGIQGLLDSIEGRLLTQIVEPESFHSFADGFTRILSARMKREGVGVREWFAKGDYERLYAFIKEVAYDAMRSVRLAQGKPASNAVELAKQYIKGHFFEKLTLDDIAGAVYLSPTYLSSVFTKECGISIGSYITKLRMEKAKEYLKNDYSVAQTARMVGYSDTRHFSKMFKKYSGGTIPSEFNSNG